MTDSNKNIPNSVELINIHLEEFVEDEDVLVLHEKESELLHTDIYIIKPSEKRRYFILLSCGLSSLPMNTPEDADDLKFVELMMLLPPDWEMNYDSFADENVYWPIRTLKQLTKYPHINNTWLGYGHTITLDKTHPVQHNFESVILLDSITLHEDFTTIKGNNKTVTVYTVIPLFKEELEHKIQEGTDSLLQKFEEHSIDEVLDIYRKNVCV